MFDAEQRKIEEQIRSYCSRSGLPEPALEWKWIPFSGHWGISTSFFALAALEARQGKKVNVPARAQELAQEIAAALKHTLDFERVEAVKGYLNLYFSTGEYTRRVVDAVLDQKENFGRGEPTSQRVMVEFSQPNTHKALHVGHLRTMILGDVMSNIIEFAGTEVVRANYLGDIGLHVVKWMWNYLKRHNGENPAGDRIRWMSDVYAEADRFYDDPEAQQEVRELFSRWDRRDPDVVDLWKTTRQWSIEGLEEVYQKMGIRFDRVYFESEVEESGKELVKDLIARGLARDERPDGAVIIPLDELCGTEQKYRVLVILRSDGTSLYATKDIPLAILKNTEYKLDKSVYVIDVRQSLYLTQIFKTLELMGFPWAKDCYHLGYEIVNLPGNVTMSSRDGTVVFLDDLLQEATNRALKIVQQKNADLAAEKQEEIARAVALGAIRYSMVSRDNLKIVTFDWESALDFDGQAAPYIQYAYVRCGSILRKAGNSLPGSILPTGELMPVEIELVDLISRFTREVQRSAIDYKPLYIANYSFELAKAFSDFYNQCPVLQVEEPIRSSRLRLVMATRQVLRNSLSLLGIQSPEAM